MSGSPEFFKPAAPAFSPACAAQPSLPLPLVPGGDDYDYDCTTPTGSRISYLKEPTTCPPAPKKPPLRPPPPPCRKRLFQSQPQPATESSSAVPVISLRLDDQELQRVFRPHPPPATTDKRRRSVSVSASSNKHCAG